MKHNSCNNRVAQWPVTPAVKQLQAFWLCQGQDRGNAQWPLGHLCFSSRICIAHSSLVAKGRCQHLSHEPGNGLKGSRCSQIKQKGSNQISGNGQQGAEQKDAGAEPSGACPPQVSECAEEPGPKPFSLPPAERSHTERAGLGHLGRRAWHACVQQSHHQVKYYDLKNFCKPLSILEK